MAVAGHNADSTIKEEKKYSGYLSIVILNLSAVNLYYHSVIDNFVVISIFIQKSFYSIDSYHIL